MYRQGDVLILPVPEDEVPAAVKESPPAPRDGRSRIVLALGEATGHAHAIVAPGELFRGRSPMEPDHLHLPSGGRLVHEEHAPITLPSGWYRVIRQREYVPGAVRPVAD
ncbi:MULTISPECIES: hypothetical protein [Thermomonospora]|uniref:Uncharacterized protein n=1 Tax=Thermomonospora cellulosilytica TaxID=1411118 RepID=A0A7W3MYV6_9ACTN|nr:MULTISPECIES: hypothetical protein [Thermomonospora]MBA9004415.1 hypothetical protein [Thermomonospora cellulosilytica]